MLIKKFDVGTAKTELVTLLETAGIVFEDGNHKCTGIMLQIDPGEATATVDVMTEETTDTVGDGITLTNADAKQPSQFSFKAGELDEVYLKASDAGTAMKIVVEHSRK